MLSSDQFRAAMARQKIQPPGEALLRSMWGRGSTHSPMARSSPDDHASDGGFVRYGRSKLADVVFELLGGERWVLGLWYRPFEHMWRRRGPSGNVVGWQRHAPAFVFLRADGFTILDVFSERELCRRQYRSQDRFFDPAASRWRWPGAEREYSELGLQYAILVLPVDARRKATEWSDCGGADLSKGSDGRNIDAESLLEGVACRATVRSRSLALPSGQVGQSYVPKLAQRWWDKFVASIEGRAERAIVLGK